MDASVGQPRCDIPRSQLEYLLQNRFTVPQISSLLNVSVRTVRPRMEEYDLSVQNFYRDHGPGRGSFIICVNNSRIERFWRDLFRGCTLLYYNRFYLMVYYNRFYLMEEGVLDPENLIHLFCLHYVYTKRLNHSLREFANAWKRHPMETEHGLSPEQLWVAGLA